ncbi:MAG: hypothetical protein R3263_04000 [Myxococcota bacterium]|nr:hypothetical protein [Myxococcota bacterium]
MSGPRIAVLVLWLALLASFLVSTSTVAVVGRVVCLLLLAAHLVECVVFLPRLRRAPGSLAAHLLQTLVFGVVHVRELPAEAASPGPGAEGRG